MFNLTTFRKILKKHDFNLRIYYTEEIIAYATACDSEVTDRQKVYANWEDRKRFNSLTFENKYQKALLTRYKLEDLSLRVYYLFGIYLFLHGLPIESIRPIPKHLLRRDARIRRTMDSIESENQKLFRNPEMDSRQFRTFLKLQEDIDQAVRLAVARYSYHLCGVKKKEFADISQVFAQVMQLQ